MHFHSNIIWLNNNIVYYNSEMCMAIINWCRQQSIERPKEHSANPSKSSSQSIEDLLLDDEDDDNDDKVTMVMVTK
jgi:hypothetical protein